MGSRPYWPDLRRTALGGSDAPAIMGLSRWAAPLTIWAHKKGLIEPDPPSEDQRIGSTLEPYVINVFVEETGYTVVADPDGMRRVLETHGNCECILCKDESENLRLWCRSKEWPWMAFTPDGIITKPFVGVLQAKTAKFWKLREWATETPQDYEIQVVHEALAAGLDRGAISCLIGNSVHRWADIGDAFMPLRETELAQKLIATEKDWWERYIQGDQEPPAAERDDPCSIYPEPEQGKLIQLTGEWADACQEEQEIANKLSHWRHERERIRNRIRQAMLQEEASAANIPGLGIYRLKKDKRGRTTLAFDAVEEA